MTELMSRLKPFLHVSGVDSEFSAPLLRAKGGVRLVATLGAQSFLPGAALRLSVAAIEPQCYASSPLLPALNLSWAGMGRTGRYLI